MKRFLLLAAFTLMLSGCIAYPAYYDYGYDDLYDGPYYSSYYPYYSYYYPYYYAYPYGYRAPNVFIGIDGFHGGHGFRHHGRFRGEGRR